MERPTPGTSSNSSVRNRPTKFVFMALGVILVVSLVVPTLVISTMTLHKTVDLETKQTFIKKKVSELEKQILGHHENLELLRKEVIILADSMEKFQEDSVRLSFLISYVTGRLLEGRGIIHETQKAFVKGQLNEKFFDWFNFTQPCAPNCIVEHGIFHKCSMSSDFKKLNMEYSLPIVNDSLTIVHADPFRLMSRHDNKTCWLDYTGPTLAVISHDDDCIYSIQTEQAPVGKLLLTPSVGCKPQLSLVRIQVIIKKRIV